MYLLSRIKKYLSPSNRSAEESLKAWRKKGNEKLYVNPVIFNSSLGYFYKYGYRTFTESLFVESSWYGHDFILSRHLGLVPNLLKHVRILHGLSLIKRSNLDVFGVSKKNEIKPIVVISPYMAKIISSCSGTVVTPIGPYISYARDMSCINFKLINCEGSAERIILHFPFFSNVMSNDVHRKTSAILNDMVNNDVADKVVYCVRSIDLNRQELQHYKKFDFVMACCGDVSNPHYLDHLKFLISSSLFTTSNIISSPFSYSLALQKVQYIIGDKASILNVHANDNLDLINCILDYFHIDNFGLVDANVPSVLGNTLYEYFGVDIYLDSDHLSLALNLNG